MIYRVKEYVDPKMEDEFICNYFFWRKRSAVEYFCNLHAPRKSLEKFLWYKLKYILMVEWRKLDAPYRR